MTDSIPIKARQLFPNYSNTYTKKTIDDLFNIWRCTPQLDDKYTIWEIVYRGKLFYLRFMYLSSKFHMSFFMRYSDATSTNTLGMGHTINQLNGLGKDILRKNFEYEDFAWAKDAPVSWGVGEDKIEL